MARDTTQSDPLSFPPPSHRYVEALEKIIHRDFFPDLPRLRGSRRICPCTLADQERSSSRSGTFIARRTASTTLGSTAGSSRNQTLPGSPFMGAHPTMRDRS